MISRIHGIYKYETHVRSSVWTQNPSRMIMQTSPRSTMGPWIATIQESGNLADSLSGWVCSPRNDRVESSGIMLESHLLRRARNGQHPCGVLAPRPLLCSSTRRAEHTQWSGSVPIQQYGMVSGSEPRGCTFRALSRSQKLILTDSVAKMLK